MAQLVVPVGLAFMQASRTYETPSEKAGIVTAELLVQVAPGTEVNLTWVLEVHALLPLEIDCDPYVPLRTPTVSPHWAAL
jgi:hypothetical protein